VSVDADSTKNSPVANCISSRDILIAYDVDLVVLTADQRWAGWELADNRQ
jgi:hypothetical protein